MQPISQEEKSNAINDQNTRVMLVLLTPPRILLLQNLEHALRRRRVRGDVRVHRYDTRRMPQVVFERLLDDTAAGAAIGVEAVHKIHHHFHTPPVPVLTYVRGGGGDSGPFGGEGSS